MLVGKGVNQIKEIVQTINTKDKNERLKLYSIIVAIFSRLDKIVENVAIIANYNQYKEEVLWSIESICGLDDGNGHSEEEHLGWAYAAIHKLESIHCFKEK